MKPRTSLNEVNIEAKDTQLQKPNPSDKQESSSTAIASHAQLVEIDEDIRPKSVLYEFSDDVRKDGLLATQVPHSGVVHNREV